jgi:hypothetical protein
VNAINRVMHARSRKHTIDKTTERGGSASPNRPYSSLRLDCSQRDEKSTRRKDCDLRVVGKNKSAIAGTFIGWLYLPPVQ